MGYATHVAAQRERQAWEARTMATKAVNPRKTAAKQDNSKVVLKSEVRKGIMLEFTETDYVAPEHKGGRSKEPNPYAEGAKLAVKMYNEGRTEKQLSLTVPTKELEKHKRWVYAAIKEHKLTAGVTTEKLSETETRLSFRATKLVERKRKPKTDAPAGETTNA